MSYGSVAQELTWEHGAVVRKAQACVIDSRGNLQSASHEFLSRLGIAVGSPCKIRIVTHPDEQAINLDVSETGSDGLLTGGDRWCRIVSQSFRSSLFLASLTPLKNISAAISDGSILLTIVGEAEAVPEGSSENTKRIEADHRSQIEAIRKSMAVAEFSIDGFILDANSTFLEIFGYQLDEILGKHHRVLIPKELRGTEEYSIFWNSLAGGLHQASQFKRIGKDGNEVWLEAVYNPVFSCDDKPYKIIKLARDVTAHVRQITEKERTIAHIASHDSLTGVLNRHGLRNGFIERALSANPVRYVFLIDLDGFKPVNDTYGHLAGDEVLKTVARRLKNVAGKNNLVGRLGGDEFMIGLAADDSEPDHMASTANSILSIIRAPIDIQGTEIFVDASIGIAVGAKENDKLDELLRMADLSLYSAKRSGKGGWHINGSV